MVKDVAVAQRAAGSIQAIDRIQLTAQLTALCRWLFRIVCALYFVCKAFTGHQMLSDIGEVLGMGRD